MMPYFIVSEATYRDTVLRYYVQRFNSGHRLNGLINNAVVYEDLQGAINAIPRLEDILRIPLRPLEIKGISGLP